MHNTGQILLGSTRQGGKHPAKVVSSVASDPATYKAGLAVRMASSGLLSLSSGFLCGVSLGKSLDDNTRTSYVRKSGGVPLRALKYSGTITISSYANLVSTSGDVIQVAGVDFTAQSSSVTLGQATFQAASSNNATATSLAAQINAHATAGAKVYAQAASAVVHLVSIEDNPSAPTLTYTDSSPTTVGASVSGSGTMTALTPTIGAAVYVHSTLGKAVVSTHTSAVVTNAIYASNDATSGALIDGIDESGSTIVCAMIDMEGGI